MSTTEKLLYGILIGMVFCVIVWAVHGVIVDSRRVCLESHMTRGLMYHKVGSVMIPIFYDKKVCDKYEHIQSNN